MNRILFRLIKIFCLVVGMMGYLYLSLSISSYPRYSWAFGYMMIPFTGFCIFLATGIKKPKPEIISEEDKNQFNSYHAGILSEIPLDLYKAQLAKDIPREKKITKKITKVKKYGRSSKHNKR